jgi:hypothetical protein
MGTEATVGRRTTMRRGFGIGMVVLVILAGIAVGVGAYNVGLDEGIARGVQDAGETSQVIRVVGDGFRGGFPLGLVFFPLFVLGMFALFRGGFRGGRWGHHYDGPGPWGKGPEEWHRRQHEQIGEPPSAGGQPA